MERFQGKCLCGEDEIILEPPPTLFCIHCRFCREAHGAARVTWVDVPKVASPQTSAAAGPRFDEPRSGLDLA